MATDYRALRNGGFMRQVQKDNFSLRLKIVGGSLTAEQLLTAVEISRKYGDGRVHLTSHQGVEIPFIKLGNVGPVRAELKEGGVDTGVYGPRVHTVATCQGSATCPSGCINTYTLATKISDCYFGRELPHKSKFRITGCQNNCLEAKENDMDIKGGYTVEWTPGTCTLCGVCLEACREGTLTQVGGKIVLEGGKCTNCGHCFEACLFDTWKGEPGYLVSFGGTFDNLIAKGRQVLPIIRDKETLFRVVDAAMAFFGKHAKPSERFRIAVDQVGWDEFETEMEAAYRE